MSAGWRNMNFEASIEPSGDQLGTRVRYREEQVRGRTEKVPPERLGVQHGCAGQAEMTVDERRYACASLPEIAAHRLNHDGVGKAVVDFRPGLE
jgi:hypothetical protein